MSTSTLPSSSTAANVQPIPAGFHTVTPHLVCGGASDAIAFYTKAFGAVEVGRVTAPDGKVLNAQIRIGDSMLMLMDEIPDCGALGAKSLKGSPVTIHLYVKDAVKFAHSAEKAGATVTMPVQEMFWGDLYGVLQDPFGHSWAVATHVRDVSHVEAQKAAATACCGA